MADTATGSASGIRDPLWHKLNPFRDLPAGKRRRLRRQIVSLLVVIIAWELIGRYGTDSKIFFVPLSDVVVAARNLWAAGELQVHIATSFAELGYGMALATVVGIAFGIVIAISQTIREYVDPYISALYATPLIAIGPLLILWFGLGIGSKIAIVFLISVFPVLINTSVGIRQADSALIEVAHSFGARRLQVIVKVLVPSAVPFVIAGIRLAVGRGIVGVVVGELFGSQAGLGHLILISGQTFDVASLFVGILLLAAAGVGLTALVQSVEGRIAKWHRFALDD